MGQGVVCGGGCGEDCSGMGAGVVRGRAVIRFLACEDAGHRGGVQEEEEDDDDEEEEEEEGEEESAPSCGRGPLHFRHSTSRMY